MKKTLLSLCSILLGSFISQAQYFQLKSEDSESIRLVQQFEEKSFDYKEINGQMMIDFSKSFRVLSQEKGAPALPLFHTTVQLPDNGSPQIEVTFDEVIIYDNVLVAPSKGSMKRNVAPSSVAYSFGAAYSSNAFYPAEPVNLKTPFIWRSMRGVVVEVSPYQYNPVTKKLVVYKGIHIQVKKNTGIHGVNELSGQTDPVMQPVQQKFVLNPKSEKYVPMEESGSMLFIAAPAMIEEITPLVNWKNQKGIRSVLVSTAATGTTDTDIQAYIQNYYSIHPELVYVLLVGDHDDIPAHTYGMSGGENLYSDSYYGQLAGSDYYPELFVGRFSGTETNITTMVDRTLEYEKNPMAGDWMEKAIGLGSNEGDGIGDDGEPDWQHLRNIRTVLMDYGYSEVAEFYDGSHGGADATGSPNSGIILPAVNNGVGLFNYTGHGDVNLCVTGNFQSTHVNQATNNGKYPFVISVACNNGTFTSGTCISEAWTRATKNGTPSGAIGAAGSSILMAWAEPMQTQDEMAAIIGETYPGNHKTTLGGLFYNSQMSMLEEYPSGSGVEVMQTWVLFGDPSAMFRNKQTLPITVTHTGNVPMNTTSITATCDVDGALVAVSQNNVLLGSAISSGGQAVITFPTLTTNDYLIVTATKQNYATYQHAVQVANGPLGIEDLNMEFSVYPNPANEELQVVVSNGTAESIRIIGLDGKVVWTNQFLNGNHETIQTASLKAGSYIIEIYSEGQSVRKNIQIMH
ncbi:C25 family cysteine peptidase [Fluviicola chungangensis]|uniref:T9SS type A sorting domain-containing protein n=1 Tax=Fluviicola chungangensis TaxID=2597671 RepID=A0A556N7P4_9FLAO|nr:C25 family cysteine peptidase [Fluviicola chungangensis]TSJ48197.1 T9SS type A sorting domain-containing protein [Fluviicola chungangensis]